MYTITFYKDCFLLENDGNDKVGKINDIISIDDNRYQITNYSLGTSWDGMTRIPEHNFIYNYERFSNRIKLLSKLTKLFKHFNIPYQIKAGEKLSFTNKKGKMYAYLL